MIMTMNGAVRVVVTDKDVGLLEHIATSAVRSMVNTCIKGGMGIPEEGMKITLGDLSERTEFVRTQLHAINALTALCHDREKAERIVFSVANGE